VVATSDIVCDLELVKNFTSLFLKKSPAAPTGFRHENTILMSAASRAR
jgi:hypothetical protein